MAKSATISLRIDDGLKRESEDILRQLGLSTSEAIKMFLSAVRNRKGIPFNVQLPAADVALVSKTSPRQSVLSLRGQYRKLTSSDEFSRHKQDEIDLAESRLRT